MIAAFHRAMDALWGRGEYSVTVPSMDGALRPNARLDEAPALLELADVDNLTIGARGSIYFTSGRTLLTWSDKSGTAVLGEFSSAISALAADRKGRLALALDTGGLALRDENGGADRAIHELANASATALTFASDGSLLACIGSSTNPASAWKRDLMSLGATGSVWRIAPAGKAKRIGDGLAFPSGVEVARDGSVVVSEAWRHRLIRRNGNKRWEPVLIDLPGYPSRLSRAPSGGWWLSVFAPRSQMIEFVLREKIYRERMMASVDEAFWMAPTLRAGKSFKEPLQGGGVRHLGIQKPWGPTRSYGLLVRLDHQFHPIKSLHSRSDGKRHGITSAVETNGRLLVTAKGDGVLFSPAINEA